MPFPVADATPHITAHPAMHNSTIIVGGHVSTIQAAVTAAEAASPVAKVFVPPGEYNESVTITGDEIELEFARGAYLSPTSTFGIKVSGAERVRLTNPHVRVESGTTATRGIWVDQSPSCRIDSPTIKLFTNPPAGYVGIDVTSDSYWCEIVFPTIRRNASETNMAKGIRFFEESNAGRVWGGAISNCDTGIEIDGSNSTGSILTAFELVTTAMEWIEPTSTGSGVGGFMLFPRLEAITNGALITESTIIPNSPPWVVQMGSNIDVVEEELVNTGGQTVLGHRSEAGIHLTSPTAQLAIGSGVGSSFFRGSSGSLAIETNGSMNITSDLDNNANGDIIFNTATVERGRFVRSDGSFRIAGPIDHNGTTIGFYGATPAAKPTITGSRGGNAALADLLTELATLGLITDSSTA